MIRWNRSLVVKALVALTAIASFAMAAAAGMRWS